MGRLHISNPWLPSCAVAALALCATSPGALALTALKSIRYSPDITVVLGGITVDHNNVAEENLAGVVTLINVGVIPSSAQIAGYDLLPNGDQLLAFDTTISLPGGLTAQPGDVVRFNGTTYTLEFDAAANGIPAGTITDAVSEIGPGDLLLSFDVTVAVGAITADDEDLVRFHNGVFTLFFDGSAANIDPVADLDAAHCIPTNGHLLLSFDLTSTVSGVNFGPADVLEFTLATTGWELSYNGLAQQPGWVGANLHGLSAALAAPVVVVVPVFKPLSGGPFGTGVFDGSTRVFGMGTAQAKLGDTCIGVFLVGPNGTPDNPPGSIDDELIGTGGTDASGNFVDTMDNPGIPLTRPLHTGDQIFLADVCQGLIGAVVNVRAPAPALSLVGLALLAVLLAAAGVRLRSRRDMRVDS